MRLRLHLRLGGLQRGGNGLDQGRGADQLSRLRAAAALRRGLGAEVVVDGRGRGRQGRVLEQGRWCWGRRLRVAKVERGLKKHNRVKVWY